MEIPLENGTISGREIFRLVWRGYFFFVLAVLTPFSILALSFIYFVGPQPQGSLAGMIMLPVMFPLVGALQGVIFGVFILTGLVIRPPR